MSPAEVSPEPANADTDAQPEHARHVQVEHARLWRLRRIVGASVLVSQALVVFFAALVAMRFSQLPGLVLVLGTAVLSGGCLILAGKLTRPWGVKAAWVWQGLCLAVAVVVPAAAVVLGLFTGLWVVGMLAVNRMDSLPAVNG